MSTLSVRLPDSIHGGIRRAAKEDHISINQFIASAVAEKLAVYNAKTWFEERVAQSDTTAFDRALKKVGKGKPAKGDELED